ncbi:MAG TPA: hypothetical protein VK861_03570, partial [Bacteroidales bacterium]|nr:hypothetical protein [Bacteroidales bacterium]
FEKLNPTISSPVTIPAYGEMMTARWGYEALAVHQFINNRYERQFYIYDKAMSRAKFKKDYWNAKVRGNLDKILNELNRGTRGSDFDDNLMLVQNEIRKEIMLMPELSFDHIEDLIPERITPDIIKSALTYLEQVRRYYVAYYNNASNRKDAIITRYEQEDKEAFQKLRDDHYNLALEEFVLAKNETQKIIEFREEIVQKLDPIYMDPSHRFIKAHFYAPVKNIFGLQVSTFIINIAVLWLIVILLYAILYFRLLKRLLDSGEMILGRRQKNNDILG